MTIHGSCQSTDTELEEPRFGAFLSFSNERLGAVDPWNAAMGEAMGIRGEPMTPEQFESISALIYRSLGLHFAGSKSLFIVRRLRLRMAALGLDRIEDYIFHLRFLDRDGLEMQALANLITTNETFMFREFEQLQAFADYCLPEVIERREHNCMRRLRIWSAGCSSGEEPYTLAIILREVMHDADEWDIQILATDIDQERLRMARRALYDAYAVREVPEAYAERHLIKQKTGQLRIHPDTAKLVKVRYLNLHDSDAMQTLRDMDFIFCRNVLIYFDEASRSSVVRRFYDSLNPGGFLYLGHSESVGRISTAFTLRRMGPHLVYCRGRGEGVP